MRPQERERVLAQLDELIIATMNAHALAGFALGIVTADRVLYRKGFGFAQFTPPYPVTPETVFHLGSITKTCTAIAVMQLWEQGKLDLDAPVNDYLHTYRLAKAQRHAPAVTARHLLTHTAGIGELRTTVFGLPRLTDALRPYFGLGARLTSPVPLLEEYYARGLTPEIAAGVKWAYANHGYATLGQLIEDLSGESFADYLRRHLFEPLGMWHTEAFRSERLREHLAQGYQFKHRTLVPAEALEVIPRGAGSICTSLEDMCAYMMALLGEGRNAQGQVLTPETLRLMMQPHYQADPRLPTAMGLGFLLDCCDGHRIVEHRGGWAGFLSAMYLAPEDGIGVIALMNTASLAPGHPGPDQVVLGMLHRLLGVPESASRLPRPAILETPVLWPELCGFYRPSKGINTNVRFWLYFGGEIQMTVSDKHLVLQGLAGAFRRGILLYRVDTTDPLLFEARFQGQTIPIAFTRNAAGHVDRLSLGFHGFFTAYKHSKASSLRCWLRLGAGLLLGLVAATVWRRRWPRRRPDATGEIRCGRVPSSERSPMISSR